MSDRLTMQDPRKQYPQPTFPRQPQPVPGLASDMDPKPDHGETSYAGSGRLVGRKALITGGDSGVGRAAAIAFAREGAADRLADPVADLSRRSPEQLDLPCPLADGGADRVRKHRRRAGRIANTASPNG